MAVSFSVLCSNTRQDQGFDGDTHDTLEPLPSTHLTAGTRGMSRFVVGIRELDDAKFDLFRKQTPQSRTWEPFPMCSDPHTKCQRAPPPGRLFPPPARAGRTGPLPGPQDSWPSWPRAWKQERHSERPEVWKAQDFEHVGIKDILASLREPELSRGQGNRNFPEAWRAFQELPNRSHQLGARVTVGGKGGSRGEE